MYIYIYGLLIYMGNALGSMVCVSSTFCGASLTIEWPHELFTFNKKFYLVWSDFIHNLF